MATIVELRSITGFKEERIETIRTLRVSLWLRVKLFSVLTLQYEEDDRKLRRSLHSHPCPLRYRYQHQSLS